MMHQPSLFEDAAPAAGLAVPAVRVRAHQRRVSWAGYENCKAELAGAREHAAQLCAAYADEVRKHGSRRQALKTALVRAQAVVLRLEVRMSGGGAGEREA